MRIFTWEWSNSTWYRLRRARPGATSVSEITPPSQKAKHILWTYTTIWPEFQGHVVNDQEGPDVLSSILPTL